RPRKGRNGREKAGDGSSRILEALGFSAVIEYPFDYEFSKRSADDFIHSILKDWLGAYEVVTGFDFHFGRGREGGPAF
ncbi:hypothetical protein ACC759_38915, partial [Rhizobium ruizarguesonis]